MIRWVVVVLCFAIPAASLAADRDLPRFASLKAEKSYMRAGPGLRYPVEWEYRKRDMPVEIVAEFDAWRQIRDWQGTTGWMHTQLLTSKRTVIVTGEVTQPLRREPRAEADIIAKVEPGVIARLIACEPEWCRIEVARFRGWLPRGAFWGVRAGEKVD